jgi:hypothetical protein
MLKYEVMAGDKWHDNGPQDLVTVSLCIQIAIDKIQLCSLSIAYAGPYHIPRATMGHSGHNVDISKPLAILAVCHFIVPSTRRTCVNMFFLYSASCVTMWSIFDIAFIQASRSADIVIR